MRQLLFDRKLTKAADKNETFYVQHTSPVSFNALVGKYTKLRGSVSTATLWNVSVQRIQTLTISLLQNCHTLVTWLSCGRGT